MVEYTPKPVLEGVIVNVTYDTLHPKSEMIAFRYSANGETYTQEFIAASLEVYENVMNVYDRMALTEDMTMLEYWHRLDGGADGPVPRCIKLSAVNKADIVLYDNDRDCLKTFQKDMLLHNGAVMLLGQTQRRKPEGLKK